MRSNIQQIKNELQEKVKERVDKNQKEYILREEMKVIREELGEDNTISDIKQFEEALEKLEAMIRSKNGFKKKLPVLKMLQTDRLRAALCAATLRRY